jgi:hypothetical protein
VSAWALLRHAIVAKVLEVGSFDEDATPIAVLELGGPGSGRTVRLPVTMDEARLLGSRVGQMVPFRLAVGGETP